MIVNFSCLKLGIGEKLFMLDMGQNDYYLQKTYKNNGKKGLHNEILQDSRYWLEIIFKLPSISLCFQFLKKNEWNEI